MIGTREAILKFSVDRNSISLAPDSQLLSIETKLFRGIELRVCVEALALFI